MFFFNSYFSILSKLLPFLYGNPASQFYPGSGPLEYVSIYLHFSKLLSWLQVLVPASYQSVPPLCFYLHLLAKPTRMSYCTCPLGVCPTTNARLFSLGFRVCYQSELLILTVYFQLRADKKPNQTKKTRTHRNH